MGRSTQLVLIVIFLIASCTPRLPIDIAAAYKNLPHQIDFNQDVKPILSDKCFSCHGPDENKRKAGLRLDIESIAKGPLPENQSKRAIVSGNLRRSQLFRRISSTDPEFMMPQPESKLILDAYERAILTKWIKDGAEYKPHWAFINPEKPRIPKVDNSQLVNNAIDNFVLNKLEKQGLTLSMEADKETLLRRLSLDVIGLPPSIGEIEDFLKDNNPNAYEKQVDRLFASPHYGERMAVEWMDVARFADTHGYQLDRLRDVSPWRDWVIKSFNENQPYDEFITWQLAGDLLPNPTKEQRIATAFLRLHPQNEEGGIVEEEFRVEYVADRVNTVGTAFMAITVGCAKCHNHKFDPISQKNYYELFSFFNNVNEAGQISLDGAMPVPTMLLTTAQQDSILDFIDQKIKAKEADQEQVITSQSPEFEDWLNAENYKEELDRKYPNGLVAHFPMDHSSLRNRLSINQLGRMEQKNSDDEKPDFVKGYKNSGLLMDGDAWLDLGEVGKFSRSQLFTIGLWVNIPSGLKNGVIFHKGVGAALYNFKGYHLALRENKLELMMACTAPYNAIIERTKDDIPRDQWIHLGITYDGSSKAKGYKAFLNGKEMEATVENDNLYKDIMIGFGNGPLVGLQIGARWRGKGIGGAKVDEIMVFNRELTALEMLQIGDFAKWKEALSKNHNELSAENNQHLKAHFLSRYSHSFLETSDQLFQLRKKFNDSIETIPELMIMHEMNERRPAYTLSRGQYDVPLDEVFPNTPEHVLPMPPEFPKNRLGLAQWLVHEDHPLTARVAVNRFWQMYCGKGLVKTTEDFGNQGERPSHPELLDWLAIHFRESDWDVKALQKMILMSAAYRQSSISSEEMIAKDPHNDLLARGPSQRLSAEMLRDNALAASNLLHRKIGGKSVFPYQPEGLWKVNGNKYEESKGNDLYRRSLYTVWKRSVPHPTQATFDAPERAECTMRRQETNTPLQALVLMNDPIFVEASKVMGEEISKSNDMATVFRKLTGRHPTKEETVVLNELYQNEYQKFKANNKRTKGWLSNAIEDFDADLDMEEVAANAVVASTIINSDAAIVKR